jgi:hypothetical protein
VPGLNTQVANLQGAATGGVCTAALAPLTGLGSDGSLPPKTSLVPIFEVGHLQTRGLRFVLRRTSHALPGPAVGIANGIGAARPCPHSVGLRQLCRPHVI